MPEVFLGQLTHSIPEGARRRANFGELFLHLRLAFDEDHGEVELVRTVLAILDQQAIGEGFLQLTLYAGGQLEKCDAEVCLRPSFLGSGVPEYPAMPAAYWVGA